MNKSSKKEREGNQMGVFESIKKACDVRLRKIASYLSKKAEGIPEQKLARTLIAVFLTLALLLTCRLVYLYKHRTEISFPSIRAPVAKPSYQPSPDQVVLERIKNFHRYLDSLKLHNEPLYDSMMKKRPHLIDSIIIIERFTNA